MGLSGRGRSWEVQYGGRVVFCAVVLEVVRYGGRASCGGLGMGVAESGQLLAILGPTGCGKTSLLNVCFIRFI